MQPQFWSLNSWIKTWTKCFTKSNNTAARWAKTHLVLVWLKGQLPNVELRGGSAVTCEPGVICDSLLRWASLPQIREWFQLITLQSCADAVRKRLSRWCRWALSQKMDSRVRQIPASRISSLGSQHCCCRSRYKHKEARLPSGLIPD